LLDAVHGQAGPVTSTVTEMGVVVPPAPIDVLPAFAARELQVVVGYERFTVAVEYCVAPTMPPT